MIDLLPQTCLLRGEGYDVIKVGRELRLTLQNLLKVGNMFCLAP